MPIEGELNAEIRVFGTEIYLMLFLPYTYYLQLASGQVHGTKTPRIRHVIIDPVYRNYDISQPMG